MMGKDSAPKLIKTMTTKYGSYAAYRRHMRQIARKGGQNGHTGGFYGDSVRAREVGKLGGRPRKPKGQYV